MQSVSFAEAGKIINEIFDRHEGIFLTVAAPNTMTIGWASTGYFWGKHVFTAVVRPSRFTYDILKKTGEFTVSVPLGDMKKELAFCGTKSGRDVNKFEALGLTAAPAQTVSAPIIGECALHLECKIMATTDLTQDRTDTQVSAACYASGDYHTLFMAEITACYRTDN